MPHHSAHTAADRKADIVRKNPTEEGAEWWGGGGNGRSSHRALCWTLLSSSRAVYHVAHGSTHARDRQGLTLNGAVGPKRVAVDDADLGRVVSPSEEATPRQHGPHDADAVVAWIGARRRAVAGCVWAPAAEAETRGVVDVEMGDGEGGNGASLGKHATEWNARIARQQQRKPGTHGRGEKTQVQREYQPTFDNGPAIQLAKCLLYPVSPSAARRSGTATTSTCASTTRLLYRGTICIVACTATPAAGVRDRAGLRVGRGGGG